MADVIAVMNKGEVLQAGTPFEIYHRPRSMFVAQFIGSPSMNFLPCGAAATGDAVRAVRPAGRACRRCARAAPAALVLGVRPEHVRLADDGARARRGVRRRVYGRPPGGDGRHRGRPRCGCAPPTASAPRSASRSASPSTPARSSCSTRRASAPCPRPCSSRRPAVAEVRLEGVTQGASATPSRSTGSISTSATASSSCCSAPPAPARPRRCGWSPAWSGPDAGRIAIGGADVTAEPARRRATSPSSSSSSRSTRTIPCSTIWPSRCARRCGARARSGSGRGSREIATLLRIDSKLENRATRLSGGEMQRVAIGRALVRRPRVYLMDEPLSSLDAKLREDLRIELKRIQRELGATILYVTHDQIEAMTMADRIGVIEAGPAAAARLAARGLRRGRPTSAVARRLGSPPINLLPMRHAARGPRAGRRRHAGRAARGRAASASGGRRGADRAGRAAGRGDRRADRSSPARGCTR